MKSNLQRHRQKYTPKLPNIFVKSSDRAVAEVVKIKQKKTTSMENSDVLVELFPHTYDKPAVSIVKGKSVEKKLCVGVVLSGGQAPGGHNVIAGLFAALKQRNNSSQLLGFLGGPSGLINNRYIVIDEIVIEQFKNSGGFDMIQSGRTKLDNTEDFKKIATNCTAAGINAIVIIGGDDSNTNAALLAEWVLTNQVPLQVIGVPKTIDGDLKNDMIEVSFGFDTACKVYSELIGNIAKDANSARKYWHFIKLMGRSASHITLECALNIQPNIAIIAEEVSQRRMSLKQVAHIIVDSIVKRAQVGNNFGIVLIPEGLIEFIPEVGKLIAEINDMLGTNSKEFAALNENQHIDWVQSHLTPQSNLVFADLPIHIAKQMLMDRDQHGNVNVSAIETEKLLIEVVKQDLTKLKSQGKYLSQFSAISHFFGYEGRSAYPSNFDADYCYALGFTAVSLIYSGLTSYMCCIKNMHLPVSDWKPFGIPLVSMMDIEKRKGVNKPVIKKALVNLDGKPFARLKANRDNWAIDSDYISPGPIQYFGPTELSDSTPVSLQLENK
ncbi:MAG: diphosphate--fructose-6-phosphate 1-phosphotransferase [Clostridiales bacterium]|jgi:pyrophosphate--fructose-6-phosphate 1-phosphotransferase|nr:diphosphate--fructose-6-phosphate 1-phosphotransferase [Clostridiales bacterium]